MPKSRSRVDQAPGDVLPDAAGSKPCPAAAMNRHMRRAAGKAPGASITKAIEGVREFSDIVEKLRPYLSQMEELQAQLETVTELLSTTQEENRVLQAALDNQREVCRHLFARGMGVSLDTVLSMESEIQDLLNHAIETPRNNSEITAENPGA